MPRRVVGRLVTLPPELYQRPELRSLLAYGAQPSDVLGYRDGYLVLAREIPLSDEAMQAFRALLHGSDREGEGDGVIDLRSVLRP